MRFKKIDGTTTQIPLISLYDIIIINHLCYKWGFDEFTRPHFADSKNRCVFHLCLRLTEGTKKDNYHVQTASFHPSKYIKISVTWLPRVPTAAESRCFFLGLLAGATRCARCEPSARRYRTRRGRGTQWPTRHRWGNDAIAGRGRRRRGDPAAAVGPSSVGGIRVVPWNREVQRGKSQEICQARQWCVSLVIQHIEYSEFQLADLYYYFLVNCISSPFLVLLVDPSLDRWNNFASHPN